LSEFKLRGSVPAQGLTEGGKKVGSKRFDNRIYIGVCDCALKLHFPVLQKKKKIGNDRARNQDKHKIQASPF